MIEAALFGEPIESLEVSLEHIGCPWDTFSGLIVVLLAGVFDGFVLG
jgi:hypothetical protein